MPGASPKPLLMSSIGHQAFDWKRHRTLIHYQNQNNTMARSTVHYADKETNNILKKLHNKLRPAGTPVQ